MTSANRQRGTGRGGRLLLSVLATAIALLALGAGGATAASTNGNRVTSTCWKDVVNDWLQHQPNVVGTYPVGCYTQAIQHLEAYPDIQQYSNAPDDIHRALLAAIHNNGGNSGGGGSSSSVGPPGSPSGSSGGSSGGGTGSGSAAPTTSGGSTSAPNNRSIVTRLFASVGPGDAQSIPLPLIVLAGLAILLLLAAAGTWVAKRFQARQARQMTPAPARARRQ